VSEFLELTVQLNRVSELARDLFTQPDRLTIARYLTGPVVSEDDLKLLADVRLGRRALAKDATAASRIAEYVMENLDRNRFPWVYEGRTDPEEREVAAAIVATASMLANQRMQTIRRNEARAKLEADVAAMLTRCGFIEAPTPARVDNSKDYPDRGRFLRGVQLGSHQADVFVGLRDGRHMPVECKVSFSHLNSIKRLKDTAARAKDWVEVVGKQNTVPVGVIAGAFKPEGLVKAQDAGLTIIWGHDLAPLRQFVQSAGTQ